MSNRARIRKTAIFCGILTLGAVVQACTVDTSSAGNGGAGPNGSAFDGGVWSGDGSAAVTDSGSVASEDASVADADAAATTCNGYEPCAVHAVAAPDGYSLASAIGVTTNDLSADGSCTDLSDCHMWNEHYTSNWNDPGGTPVNPYWNRMGSPFWWPLSRYLVVVPPKKITTAKLHVLMPGEMYKYADGTVVMQIDRMSGARTCYARRNATLEIGQIQTMGGTGNLGQVHFVIGALPYDMGNTGNVSPCTGSGNDEVIITEDEAKAAASFSTTTNKYQLCLLRPGHDYWVSFESSGKTYTTDCATAACTMGGFGFGDGYTMSDGGHFSEVVPCP